MNAPGNRIREHRSIFDTEFVSVSDVLAWNFKENQIAICYAVVWPSNNEVLEGWDSALSNHTIKSYVCQSMLKVLKIIILNFDMVWLEGLESQLCKTFLDWKLVEY